MKEYVGVFYVPLIQESNEKDPKVPFLVIIPKGGFV